jgi:hypothetical protein
MSITENEWKERFKARFREIGFTDEDFIEDAAEASCGEYFGQDDYDPEDAADDEYSELSASL